MYTYGTSSYVVLGLGRSGEREGNPLAKVEGTIAIHYDHQLAREGEIQQSSVSSSLLYLAEAEHDKNLSIGPPAK